MLVVFLKINYSIRFPFYCSIYFLYLVYYKLLRLWYNHKKQQFFQEHPIQTWLSSLCVVLFFGNEIVEKGIKNEINIRLAN
jgi:hypothetical protein